MSWKQRPWPVNLVSDKNNMLLDVCINLAEDMSHTYGVFHGYLYDLPYISEAEVI